MYATWLTILTSFVDQIRKKTVIGEKNSSKKLWSPLTKNLFTKPGELSRGLMADLVPSITRGKITITRDKIMIGLRLITFAFL